MHSHLHRLREAPLHLRYRSHLPAETDFADEHGMRINGPVVHARRERCGYGEIAGRLLKPRPAHDVEEHVQRRERKSRAPLEHRQEEGQAPPIESSGHALRRSVAGLRGERLHFDEHGPCAFNQRRNGAARRMMSCAIAQEERRRILNWHESARRHAEHADLVHRTEAILGGAQHAMVE